MLFNIFHNYRNCPKYVTRQVLKQVSETQKQHNQKNLETLCIKIMLEEKHTQQIQEL